MRLFAVLFVAVVLAVAAEEAAAAIPTGHYAGRTSQHSAVGFDFVKKKGIVPQLDPSGPALYDFSTTATFQCNRGGPVRRRVFFAVALTDAHGVFATSGSGTTPTPGESQTFSLAGRLRPDGGARGSLHQTVNDAGGAQGRTCSTGTIRWTAKLRARKLAAVGLAAAAETPGGFITRILKDEIHGEWSLQWQSLHPGHKALITESQYVACSRVMGTDFATGREVFRVVSVRNDPIAVRGVPQRTSKLVTITLRQREKANGLTYHMHAVRVEGRWTWILGKRFLSQVAQGRCLDGSPLQR